MCLGQIGRVEWVWEEDGVPMAAVRTAEGELRASLLLLPATRPGADVVVQLGFVVEVLDPREAAAALALRRGEEPSGEEPEGPG